MKLTIVERLVLLGTLPETGDLRTVRVVQDLRAALGLTAEEIAAWDVKNQKDEDGKTTGVVWDDKKVEEAEIDVAGVKTEIIVETLRKLDQEKSLLAQHLSLCEKFPLDAGKA